MKLKLLIIVALIPYCISNVDLNGYWCSSCDDPHLKTFDGYNYEFQHAGDFYVMFADYLNTRVTASFRPCTCGIQSGPTCNCGVHVKNGDSYFYLDTCGIEANSSLLKFYFTDPSTSLPTLARCDSKTVSAADETNDVWWNTRGNAFSIPSGDILCAKSSHLYKTYFIRTADPQNYYNIYVKVMLHDFGISCLYIRPSQYSLKRSGGLCGFFDTVSYPGDPFDLFYWSLITLLKKTSIPNNGYYKIRTTNAADLAKFWRLNTVQPPALVYKLLDNNMCLCDRTYLPSFTPNTDKCTVLLSKCLARNRNAMTTDCVHSVGERQKIKIENVENECRDIFDQGKLTEANKLGLITQDNFKELFNFCVVDLKGTDDILWAVLQVQIGQNWALDTCEKKMPENANDLCDQFRKTPAKCLFTDKLNDRRLTDACLKLEVI